MDLPEELKTLKQFCVRVGKKPYIRSESGLGFSSVRWATRPGGWLSYQEAVEAAEARTMVAVDDSECSELDGIGFLVEKNDKRILGGDLDCCRDPETGLISQWAQDLLREMQPFYTEVSPSKCGLRFFIHGELGQNSIFGNGNQTDLPVEMQERILAAKPKAREKTGPVFNGLELYENGRHLTLTGERIDELCFPKEDQTAAITEAIKPFLLKSPKKEEITSRGVCDNDWIDHNRLPKLNITDMIDTNGFKKEGGQLFGPHPTLGSTTGRNLVVNPSKNIYCYMHNNINKGGDAWTWLACECGAIRWEEAGKGVLKDRDMLGKTLRYAIAKGLIREEEVKLYNPAIRIVSLDDDPGCVGIDVDGTIKKVEIDHKSGEKSLGWLSDCALFIHTETRADDETEFCFKGVGAQDKRQVCFTLQAAALADARKFKGALLNAFGAKNRIGRLDFETVQRISINTQLLRRIEVPTWDGSIPLIPGVGLADNVEFKLSKMTPANVYEGDTDVAKECLRKLLGLNDYAPLLVTAIMGAPAYARWHINDRFGVALWGLTGSLKTSAAQAAMSIYGVGYLDDAALFKHGRTGSTQVAALEIFASAGVLPQILDNVKTVDPKDSLQYVSLIQAVVEGREKQRGQKEGGLRDTRTFACTPIITGEIRPEEASTSARVLNLDWVPPDTSKLSYVQEHIEAMPVIGYFWLQFLATTELDLLQHFQETRNHKMSEFTAKRYTNPGRLATIYTLMRATWNLLCESPMRDVFGEFTSEFISGLNYAIEEQGIKVTEETEVSKFMAGVTELLASDPGLIETESSGHRVGSRVIGKRSKEGLFLLPNETLAELAKRKVFTQQPTVDSITKALNDAGLLVATDGRHLKAERRIGGQKVRGWLLRKESASTGKIAKKMISIPEAVSSVQPA